MLQITREQVLQKLQTSDFDPVELYLWWQENKSKQKTSSNKRTKPKTKKPHPLARFIGTIEPDEGDQMLKAIEENKQIQKQLQKQKTNNLTELF